MRADWIKGSYKLLRNFRVLLLSSLTKSRRSRMSFHGSDPYGKLKVGRGPHFSFVMRQASLAALTLILVTGPLLLAQSSQSQNPSSPPSNAQSQDIPDAPSTVQPPSPKPAPEPEAAPPRPQGSEPEESPSKNSNPDGSSSTEPGQQTQPPPSTPPVQTVPPGSVPAGDSETGTGPKNQVNPTEPLYKLRVQTNFVQLPVLVKDGQGRRVYGLAPRDFTVNENGKPQELTYFTSDPFPLSVAIVLDTGMADVVLLDNMDLATLREAVRIAEGRVVLEASGGVKPDSIAGIAATGVDYASAGALTHSAPNFDVALDIDA